MKGESEGERERALLCVRVWDMVPRAVKERERQREREREERERERERESE